MISNEMLEDIATYSIKNAVWSRITILASALSIAARSHKHGKRKNKEAKNVFCKLNSEQRVTGGSQQPKKLCLAMERKILLELRFFQRE